MTATRLAFALTIALMLSPRAALALDGNQILQTCENTSGYNQGFCLGYLMGVVDSLVNGAAPVMCTNDFVTLGQMRDIVLKFLSDHPESRHCGAIDITYVSLRNLFPCPGKPMPPLPPTLC
jgi:Rap1a immunity proteins